ncbi:MAG TPA: hypothetical protein VK081_02165 [Planctomycetota bacterium]|nr:hypothetical protein [Planctomycetota bacterium]
MRLTLNSLVGAALAAVPFTFPAVAQEHTVRGERVPASAISPPVLETMEEVMERERRLPPAPPRKLTWSGEDGRWFVPPPSARTPVHSGQYAVVNEWGDPRIGIGFPEPTDVVDLWAAGHGGAPARAVRFLGFRAGTEVAATPWIALGNRPQRIELGFTAVDRIEMRTAPYVERFGFVAIDDLAFAPAGKPAQARVLDFEDLAHRQVLTGTRYAGLTWESGTGFQGPPPPPPTDIVPAPRNPDEGQEPAIDDTWYPPLGAEPSQPRVWDEFVGTTMGDTGASYIPPDTCGANGPDHYVAITNSNLSAWRKSDRVRTVNTSLTAFFPGSSGTVGDPRIVFDPHSRRYVALATNFSGGGMIFVAVSQTSDPAGAWYKFSFATAQGSDAGRWPDYPTLGVDARGIYTSAYMVGGSARMTIWAIDKAPLVANPPSLGTITAFRGLTFEGAMQPCTTYGDPGAQYIVSRSSSTALRVRRVNPPLTAPTLTTLGTVTIPSHSSPPTAPALGSTTNINTLDTRLINAVFRNGSIYTVHGVSVNGRAGCRWYQVGVSPLSLQQSGTIADSLWHYYYPSIAVNAHGNVGIGFSGSHANAYCSVFITGRRPSDPPGTTAPPILVKAGEDAWNRLDAAGRNRFGDYSHIDVDAVDDFGFWTNQEYIIATNRWRTRVARFGFEAVLYGDGLAGTAGVPEIGVGGRPRIGATVNLQLGNPLGAPSTGALVFGTAPASIPLLGGTVHVAPTAVFTVGIPANGLSIPLAYPDDPGMVGVPVYFQYAMLDSNAPSLVAFSRGLEVRANSR